jgi:hypothetical protein
MGLARSAVLHRKVRVIFWFLFVGKQGFDVRSLGSLDRLDLRPYGCRHWRTYYRHMEQLREAESRAVPPWLFKYLV